MKRAACIFVYLIGGTAGAFAADVPAHSSNGCSIMSISKLHQNHPLTKVGLQHIRVVRQLEVGAKPGDVVFQFPHGKMILEKDPNGMLKMPRRENIIPNGANNALVFQEAKILEFKEREKGGCP